ncbi:unnamed protein product [Brassica oleracea]
MTIWHDKYGISKVSGMKISSDTLELTQNWKRYLSSLTCLGTIGSVSKLLPYTLVVEFEFKIEAWPIKLSYVPPCFVSALMYVQLSTPVTTRTSSQMTLAVSEELPCSEELTRSEIFLDIVKKIKKVQRKSRRCNIVIG